MDGSGDVPTFPGFDKLVHTGFFFVLTILLYYGEIRKRETSRPLLAITVQVVLVSVFFGAFIEYLQWQVFTYRSAEAWDLFADTVGTGMGVFAYLLLHNTYRYDT